MDNKINSISFGAHLSLKNANLNNCISREMANEFARATRSINGTMNLQKSYGGLLSASINGKDILLDGNIFYGLDNKEKVNTLIRSAKYIQELIRFENLPRIAKVNVDKHIRNLDKIAGNDETMDTFHNLGKMHILKRYV